jgi:hypothetical protein
MWCNVVLEVLQPLFMVALLLIIALSLKSVICFGGLVLVLGDVSQHLCYSGQHCK